MASTPSRNQWWRPKRLLMCMNGLPLTVGTNVLGILLLKLSIILLRIFLFPFHRTKMCRLYVIHVLLIKHINNLFVLLVSKVMNHLNMNDGSRYYLIFVDHYTKYIWFYPMVTKSGVSNIFPHFVTWKRKNNFFSYFIDMKWNKLQYNTTWSKDNI